MNKHKNKNLFILLCVAPATLMLLLFVAYPTLQVFRTSLYRKPNFVADAEFIGLENFKILFADKNFIIAMQNTILYVVLITLITVVLAVLFSTLLTREKFRFKGFFRVVFYIPNILSMVVVAGIFSAIYAPTNGLLNALLDMVGLDNLRQQWLGNPSIINYSIIVALIWQAIGYYMVMYMSSMSAIPEQLYEAASIEGASKWTQFIDITFPLIWNNIRTTLTFFIISTINLSFMFVQLTTEGTLGTENALHYMFTRAFGGGYSYGMAVGSIVFLFSFLLSAILNRVTDREVLQY